MPSLKNGPAETLAFLLEAYNTRAPSLFLVTGASGSGKTHWCQAVLEFARGHSWPVSGLLSPAVIRHGMKIGIELLDLSSGERRRLATHINTAAAEAGHALTGEICTGEWSFCPETLAWGNSVLQRTTRADFVILDELGPLEFRLGQGLRAGLELLDAWRYRLACVTVRPPLVGAVRMRWPWGRLMVVDGVSQATKHD